MSVSFRLGKSPSALRAFFVAEELFALLLGRRLAAFRESGGASGAAFARIQELELRVALLSRWIDVLVGRWEKVPERRRPQYDGGQRYEIVSLKRAEGLTARETARRAGLSTGTIHRWEADAAREPHATSLGTLLRPVPPIRRISDAARAFVMRMDADGFGGARSIALHLLRATVRLSATTVRRIRREGPAPRSNSVAPTRIRALRAQRPGEIFLSDLTDVPGWLGAFRFKVGVVMDAFSRYPLASKVWIKEPSAGEVRDLLRKAFRRGGRPATFVTDRGSSFASKKVEIFLRRKGVRHRFGALGKHGSIALIERLWRTLKQRLALRSLPPLVLEDLERRLTLGLEHYAKHRPHQGLGGATPEEVFLGKRPAVLDALPAPRGRLGERSPPLPLRIAYLDRERLLPILVSDTPRAAAA